MAAAGIDEALAQLASALRTPVLILALLALGACALEGGRFLTEWWTRTRAGRGALRALASRIVSEPERAPALAPGAPSSFAADALLRLARASGSGDRSGVEHALTDYELAAQRRLDRTRILVRAGPALGLMGTLIPLAPGLSALGHGDISTLAGDLRTAFAATTIGLLVGMIAYALTLARTRMYSEDLSALEQAAAAVGPAPAGRATAPAAPLAGQPAQALVGQPAQAVAPISVPSPTAIPSKRVTSRPNGPTGEPDHTTAPPLPAPRQ
jgi:biopolymer transport protein ExbB/TolQ